MVANVLTEAKTAHVWLDFLYNKAFRTEMSQPAHHQRAENRQSYPFLLFTLKYLRPARKGPAARRISQPALKLSFVGIAGALPHSIRQNA